jgi:hypothetical protein
MNDSMSSRRARLELAPPRLQEPGRQLERVEGGLDRAAGLVLGSQVQLEGAD